MKRRMTRAGCEIATLLWGCVALFAARVIGQFEALTLAPSWLPDMDAWYSGLLPYHLLLPAQIAILMIMSVVAWNRRVRTGRFAAAQPRVAGALRSFAGLYFAAMAVRLAINVAENGADFWRMGAIPVAFHWVLALFLMVSGRTSTLLEAPARRRHIAIETTDEPHGDVPALVPNLLQLSDYRSNYRPDADQLGKM
jgi:hypothetical protein